MKRMLLITEVFPPRTGGSGRWFWEIYTRLPSSRIVVAAGESPGHETFDRGHDLVLRRLPLTFPSLGLLSARGLWHYYRVFLGLQRWVREQRIEETHCGKCLPEGLLAWMLSRKLGLPYSCYVHGEELGIAAGSRELRFWARRVLLGADRVIANSHNTAGMLCDNWGVNSAKLHVMHPGVDTKRFRPAARDPESRRRLGWSHRPVILTVGRLQKRKGHDMLLRALPRIRQMVPDVLYAIVGEGEERPTLEALTRDSQLEPHVCFHGELCDDDMLLCYQQCDLFVLPNRQVGRDFEGFGMVLLEAQACGKPVIAGASGGTAETMRVGETGRIVPCTSPGPLANAVIEMLTNEERYGVGSAARSWAVEHFDWDSLADQAKKLFGFVPDALHCPPWQQPCNPFRADFDASPNEAGL